MVGLLGLLSACSTDGGNDSQFRRTVVLTQPEHVGGEVVKRYSGVIVESKKISVGFKTPGQISSIRVKEGDYVKEGQLLATLDDKDYKLGVEAAQLQYDQLKNELARLKKLYDAQSISANDYEKAASGLEQLGVQLQSNKNKMEYTKLYAPSSGYINKVNFEESEMVDAGTALFSLLDTKDMEVSLNIPADLYVQRERITKISGVTPFGGDAKRMKMLSSAAKADGNQLYEIRLGFADKPDAQLTSGMNIGIDITMAVEDGESNGWTLPMHAIFYEGEQAYVWKLQKDTTVSRKSVAVGKIDGEGRAMINTPLRGDEKIVKAGATHLREGDKVVVWQSK